MAWLDLYTAQFVAFTLVLTRVSGVVITAPLYGSVDVPPQIRALLALSLAVLVAPTQIAAPFAAPADLVEYLIVLASELLLGMVLGMGVSILLAGVQLAGQVMAQVSGLSIAEVFNPTLDTSLPLFSQLLYLFSVSMYLLIGGHRWLLAGLLDTFATIPLGRASVPEALSHTLVDIVTESFSLGVRAAGPVTVALLLATVVLGLISRTLPQLNVLAVGFGFNAMATFGALSVSLGALAWVFQEELETSVDALLDAIAQAAPTALAWAPL